MQMPMRELDESLNQNYVVGFSSNNNNNNHPNDNDSSSSSDPSGVVFHDDDKKASCVVPCSPSSSAGFGNNFQRTERLVPSPSPSPSSSPPESHTKEDEDWSQFLNMTASVLALTSTSEEPTKSSSAMQYRGSGNEDAHPNQNESVDKMSFGMRNRVRRHSLSEPFVMTEETESNPWRPLGRRATLTPQAASSHHHHHHQKESRLRANSYAAFSSAEMGNLSLNLNLTTASTTTTTTTTTAGTNDINHKDELLSYSSADSCHSESSTRSLSLVEEQYQEDTMMTTTTTTPAINSGPKLELALDLDGLEPLPKGSSSSSSSSNPISHRHSSRNRLHLSLPLDSSQEASVMHPQRRNDLEFMNDSGDDDLVVDFTGPLGAGSGISSDTTTTTAAMGGMERMSPKLYHVKSPVLSTRRDSQTWQLQEEELLGSPRFCSVNTSSSPSPLPSPSTQSTCSSGQAPADASSSAKNGIHMQQQQMTHPRTKDMRAASFDFSSFRRSPSPNAPPPSLPPPPPPSQQQPHQAQQQHQQHQLDDDDNASGRSRARSFSYSTTNSSYGGPSSTGAYSNLMDAHRQRGSPWNGINRPILRPPHPHELHDLANSNEQLRMFGVSSPPPPHHQHHHQHHQHPPHLAPPPPPPTGSPRHEARARSASSCSLSSLSSPMTFTIREDSRGTGLSSSSSGPGNDDVLINDVRKLSIEIPHPPHSPNHFAPMPPYAQYSSQVPPPARRYSGDGGNAFVMAPYPEPFGATGSAEYDHMSGRGANRGMRSYSMECMTYSSHRNGSGGGAGNGQLPPHDGGRVFHQASPPPCELFPHPVNSTTTPNGGGGGNGNGGGGNGSSSQSGFDWPRPMMEPPQPHHTNTPVSPPLPPDSRPLSSSYRRTTNNMPYPPPFAPPEAYYEVEFKRGRQEVFAGNGSFNPGEFVKVEADRGEDIGRIVKRLDGVRLGGTCLNHVHGHGNGAAAAGAGNGNAMLGYGEPLGSTAPLPPPPENEVHVPVMTTTPSSSSSSKQRHDVKRILCLASAKECELLDAQRREESEVFEVCKSKVRQRLLPMNVIDAEYQFDRHKLTFFFEADRRIDFRELVRDLFAIYKTRIWLQQVVSSTRKASSSSYGTTSSSGFAMFGGGDEPGAL